MSSLDIFRILLLGVQLGMLIAQIVSHSSGNHNLARSYMFAVLGTGLLIVLLGQLA